MQRSGLPFRRWFNVAVAIFVVLLLFALILPAIQQAREAARRSLVQSNLHGFGLALHNYQDSHGSFPPGGVIGGDGPPFHGWCLMLAPYMEASPLYNRINFDVPWDDPENDFLWQREIPWCLSPHVVERRTPEGYGLLHYQANPLLLHRNSSVTLDVLSAGAADTWAMGEAGGEFTPYAYPFNWRPLGTRLNAGTSGFGLPGKTGLHFLFADGSVRFVSSEMSADVLRAMADAPPVPEPARVAVPPRPAAYQCSGRHEEIVALGSGEFSTNLACALLDRSDVPIHVTFVCFEKNPDRCAPFTSRDVRTTVAAFPRMKSLYGTPVITDEIADVLAALSDLETLHAEGASLSEQGLQGLASLQNLKRLLLSNGDDSTVEALQKALPDCEIQVAHWQVDVP
jgi:hypothetical protein